MFRQSQGKIDTKYYAVTPSTAIAQGALVTLSSGKLVAATSSTSKRDIVGVLAIDITATDADYALDRRVPVFVPSEPGVLWEVAVTGLAATDEGSYFDISDSVTIDLTASTQNVVKCVRYLSSTLGYFELMISDVNPEQFTQSVTFTNATTDNTLSIDQNGNVGTSVATDGAVHIENTGNTGIGLGVYTNIGSTGAAELISIKIDNVAFTKEAVVISNDGTGDGITIAQNGVMDASTYGFLLYSNAAQVSASTRLAKLHLDHADSSIQLLEIVNDGTGTTVNITGNGSGRALYIDHNDTGTNASIDIDRDGNNAAYIFGIKVTVDNAGVGGLVCGIDFSGMSDTEPLFKFPSASPDADLSTKSPETDAEAGWIPVLYGTTVYAMPVYALS